MTRTPVLRRWCVALVAVALAFASAIAVPVTAQAIPVASTIIGSVADPASVNTGDTVKLWEFPAGGSSFGFLTTTSIDSTGAFSFATTVDTNASYAVVVDTTAPGYEPTWSDNTVFGPDLATDPGALPGGPSLDFGVITMAADITVSGTITDANGPVDNVVVLLLRVGDSSPVSGAVTDVNGDYHIPFVTNTRVLIGAEVPLGAPTGYAMQFWSGEPSPGTGQSIVTAGAPGSDMPGHDFTLLPTTDTINILSTYLLSGVGCGCGGFPQTTVHLYLKSGDYWTPIATDSDLGSLLSGFVEFTPGDYRLRFTDPSGGWLPINTVSDTNPGTYVTAPTPDGCAVELDGLALGDQPTLDIDLDVASASCGDEPAPPPPSVPPVIHRSGSIHSTTSAPEVTDTPTPTPTPTPTVSRSPTPAPTVTTQAPPHPKPTAVVDLAWVWWLVGIVVVVLVLAAVFLILFRRRP